MSLLLRKLIFRPFLPTKSHLLDEANRRFDTRSTRYFIFLTVTIPYKAYNSVLLVCEKDVSQVLKQKGMPQPEHPLFALMRDQYYLFIKIIKKN